MTEVASVYSDEPRIYCRSLVAEVGLAAHGVPPIPWLAACYSFWGDRSPDCHSQLWYALVFEAQRIGRRERWAPQVRGSNGRPVFYQQELAQLVLEVDANRQLFAAEPRLYAVRLKVALATWTHPLSARYCALRSRYESWLSIARAVIDPRFSDEDDASEPKLP